MLDLSQHPTSKVAWDLQGPSMVQQCQHNDKFIIYSNLPGLEIATVDVSADLRLPHCMHSMINGVNKMSIT